MLGRIDMRFNPKFPPLDSGSGAGMTVMQRSPFAGKTEEDAGITNGGVGEVGDHKGRPYKGLVEGVGGPRTAPTGGKGVGVCLLWAG